MTLHASAIIDITGLRPTAQEAQRLLHPGVAGVIFFSRNFESPAQLRALVSELETLRPSLLFCVDHEGGRVQRFRQGFTRIPPMRSIGLLWDTDQDAAIRAARAAGFVIASELSAHGLDFSFAPVLDLDYGASDVIGNRAFHRSPEAVGRLAAALVAGLRDGGMPAVGKHFPGHGHVSADSHLAVPVDDRPVSELMRDDVLPYRIAISAGLPAIMPAHVIYSSAEQQPAGYSRYWLREVLRSELRFDGLIFSDDLSMVGASGAGGIADRARCAMEAGCDLVLLCNDPSAQDELLEALQAMENPSQRTPECMRGQRSGRLIQTERYRQAVELLGTIQTQA